MDTPSGEFAIVNMGFKYKNIITTIDNVKFSSKKESYRYLELKSMLKTKKIRALVLQPMFVLLDKFTRSGRAHV